MTNMICGKNDRSIALRTPHSRSAGVPDDAAPWWRGEDESANTCQPARRGPLVGGRPHGRSLIATTVVGRMVRVWTGPSTFGRREDVQKRHRGCWGAVASKGASAIDARLLTIHNVLAKQVHCRMRTHSADARSFERDPKPWV